MSPMRSARITFLIILLILLLYPFYSNGFEQDQLVLLATIGPGGSTSKAIIKNHFTGNLKTYSQGDVILVADDDYAIVAEVSSCLVVLKSKWRYETLDCDNVRLERTFRVPSPLARFDVIDKRIRNSIVDKNFESEFENEILSAGERYGVDPYLIRAVIKVESNFNPQAVSPKKAMGMMQLIPETASLYGVENPFDPEDNIDGGVRHLRDLMKYFEGDLELVLSAYNAGKEAVIKYGYDIPPYPETEAYVEKVLAYYNHIKNTRYLSWR